MVQPTQKDIELTLKYGLGGVTTIKEAREHTLADARDCNKDFNNENKANG